MSDEDGRRSFTRPCPTCSGVAQYKDGLFIGHVPDVEGWWTISGQAFLAALQRAHAREDPNLLYAEYYANSDTEMP